MNQACMAPHWTSFVTALLVPTIALFGAFIAYQQWRTAREKLKLDLFDKRFAVYDTARNFIGNIVTQGKVTDEQFFVFLNGTIEAKWLFGNGIANYLKNNLYDPARELQGIQFELSAQTADKDQQSNLKRMFEIIKAFGDELNGIEQLFDEFLQLKN